jgi:integrase
MSEFIAVLGARKATAALALELLILTNVRTNAVLQAKWPEFDLDKALWNVPLVNLKDREHRKESFDVPLSPRAVEIVKEMEKARVSAYAFPGQRKGQPLSNMAFLMLLKRMNATPKGEQSDPDAKAKWHDPASGRAITAHGFRATFKTWAEEVATFPHAAIEHAMGHKVGGKVERAYTRTTLLDMRRKLMDAWAPIVSPKPQTKRSRRCGGKRSGKREAHRQAGQPTSRCIAPFPCALYDAKRMHAHVRKRKTHSLVRADGKADG